MRYRSTFFHCIKYKDLGAQTLAYEIDFQVNILWKNGKKNNKQQQTTTTIKIITKNKM